jgi:hypothetical protein
VVIISMRLKPFTFHRCLSFSNIWQMWSKNLWISSRKWKILLLRLCLQKCDNIVIRGFTIGWNPRPISEKKILQCWYYLNILT